MTTPPLYTSTCAICSETFEARSSYGLCPLCWSRDQLREYDRLEAALRSARRKQVPATLTLPQWLSTCSDFHGVCAYCLEVPYSFIEPVIEEAGVTYQNVVPICRACAIHKRSESFEKAAWRVAVYLSSQERPTYLAPNPDGDEAPHQQEEVEV